MSGCLKQESRDRRASQEGKHRGFHPGNPEQWPTRKL